MPRTQNPNRMTEYLAPDDSPVIGSPFRTRDKGRVTVAQSLAVVLICVVVLGAAFLVCRFN